MFRSQGEKDLEHVCHLLELVGGLSVNELLGLFEQFPLKGGFPLLHIEDKGVRMSTGFADN